MAEVTIRQVSEPSKSKKGGPCWLAVATSEDSGLTFANHTPQTLDVGIGQEITVVGKANLRKQSGGIDKDGTKRLLKATGKQEDVIVVSVGSHMGVRAEITGVIEDD